MTAGHHSAPREAHRLYTEMGATGWRGSWKGHPAAEPDKRFV